MKFSTSSKVLALAASLLLTGLLPTGAKPKKPSGGSVSADLVISKVFYNNMMNDEGKAFIMGNYIELLNNSADTLDITGIYLGLADNTSSTSADFVNAWTATAMQDAHKDSIALKQIFQIPTEQTCLVAPGQSIVICNAAENHTTVASAAADLSGADFEVKSEHTAYKDHHNAEVPELKLVFTYSANNTFLQFMSPGPFGLVLLAADTNVEGCPVGYYKGKTEGSQFKFVPAFKTIDAVDFVEHSVKTEPDAAQKRIGDNYDAGWTATATPGGNNGEALVRKTAFVTKSGRKVLFDTNNSSVDFEVTTDLAIRTYSDEVKGLSDSTIVIPESGFLAINPSTSFFGPDNMLFAYVNASAKSANFNYNEFAGDSIMMMKGDWIAIAQPGTYTLKMSEAQAMLRSRSTAQQWSTEDHKELTGGQKTRSIYKFSNAAGKVGFQRVPKTAEGGYNVADFTDGERLYVTLTPAIVTNFSQTFGVTDLDFIPWSGSTPTSITEGIETVGVKPAAEGVVFDLQGRRVSGTPRHGLYIVNGKKVLF